MCVSIARSIVYSTAIVVIVVASTLTDSRKYLLLMYTIASIWHHCYCVHACANSTIHYTTLHYTVLMDCFCGSRSHLAVVEQL
jgi:hypothetical protein